MKMALKSSLRGGGNGRPLLLILLGSGSNRVIIKFFFSVTRSNPVTPKVEQSLGREKMQCGREMAGESSSLAGHKGRARGEAAVPRGSGQNAACHISAECGRAVRVSCSSRGNLEERDQDSCPCGTLGGGHGCVPYRLEFGDAALVSS